MENEIELISSIEDEFNIKIFGKKIKDVSFESSKSAFFSKVNTKLIFAKVYGTKVLDECITLSKPFFTVLPDNGVKPDGCGSFGNPNEYLMWVLPKSQPLIKLTAETGSLGEVITETLHPNLDVNAIFQIQNLKVNGTTVSGTLKAYLHFHQPGPFGTTIFDITPINASYPFLINLVPNTCITVFSIGIASAQICFYPQPNRICGTVDVGINLPVLGHWGQKFNIACINL